MTLSPEIALTKVDAVDLQKKQLLPKSRRWADILDDSSEDEFADSAQVRVGLSMLPTALEDSYQSKPDSALEDSRTGLNAAMSALTSESGTKVCNRSDPKDFSFLLKAYKLGSEGGEDEMSKTNATKWTPQFKKKRNNDMSGARILQRKMPRTRGRGQPKSFNTAENASTRLDKAALEDEGVDTASVSTLAPHEMPESTDEVWQHRQATRVKDVEVVMASNAYQRFCDVVHEDQRHCCSLVGPDPYDRTISKRKWKTAVNLWFYQLLMAAQSMDFGDKGEVKEKTSALKEQKELKLTWR
jgi:hypothetical protein